MKLDLESEIGAREDVYPEQFARSYKSLRDEFKQVYDLAIFRRGRSPRIASVKVNEKCNFNCSHCNANQIRGREMTTEEIFNVQRNLKEAGVQMHRI